MDYIGLFAKFIEELQSHFDALYEKNKQLEAENYELKNRLAESRKRKREEPEFLSASIPILEPEPELSSKRCSVEEKSVFLTCKFFNITNYRLKKRDPSLCVPFNSDFDINFKNPHNIKSDLFEIPTCRNSDYRIPAGVKKTDFIYPFNDNIWTNPLSRKLEFEDKREFTYRFEKPYIIILLPIDPEDFIRKSHIYVVLLKAISGKIYVTETLKSEYTIEEFLSDVLHYKSPGKTYNDIIFDKRIKLMTFANLSRFVRIRNSDIGK